MDIVSLNGPCQLPVTATISNKRFERRTLKVLNYNEPYEEEAQENKGIKRRHSEEGNYELPECFSHYIINEFALLQLILSQLEWNDLMNAAEVCTAWKKSAILIDKARLGVNWFYLDAFPSLRRLKKPFLLYKNGPQLSRPKMTIIFRTKVAKYLYFSHSIVENESQKICPKKHSILDFLVHKLKPSKGDIISAEVDAVHVLYHPPPSPKSNHLDRRCALAGLTIPQIRDVKMAKFRFNMFEPLFQDHFQAKIGKDNYVKCLLFFFNYQQPTSAYNETNFLNIISQYQGDEPFACGGAFASEVKDVVSETDKGQWNYAVVFSVPKNVPVLFRATSFYLGYAVKDKISINATMRKVAQSYVRRKNEMALRFACVRRKALTHIEIECFNSNFPSIPVLSLDGFGEFSVNCVPDAPENPEINDRGTKELMRVDTTAIVILSWGHPV